MGTTREKKDRNLKAFDLTSANGKTWIVVDMDSKEILSIGIKEFNDYSKDKFPRYVIYEPIEFKEHSDAKKFIDGEMSIGHIQESLTELNVGFQKTFIS